MKRAACWYRGVYQATLGRLGLRQRLLVMLLSLVVVAIGISFYSEYTIHREMLEAEIADDVQTVSSLLLSSLEFRDGQPFLPFDPRRSPLNERVFGEERVRFRIVQVSVSDAPRVLVQGGGNFPEPSVLSLWARARADSVWHVTTLWLDQTRTLQPEPLLQEGISTPANAIRVDIALEVSERYAGLAAYLQRELLVLPLTFVITALLAWWLVRQILEPLAKLTEATRQLQRQRFPEPLPVASEHDEIGMLTANFNVMVAEVRGMLERERSFTRYASHELRTPLSTLKAQLEALELGLMPPEQVMPTMQHALADTETILGALLQLSRLEQPRLEPLPLSGVMGQLEQQVATDRIRFHIPADIWLLSHHDLLSQVLSNLISNALKYSDGHIDVCVQQADPQVDVNTVTISVRDYGAGVPEEVLAKLTTPFFRVQGSRAKGWGLGLALSEHIVRSLDGEITFGNVYANNVYAKDAEAERYAVSDAAYGVVEGFVAQITLPLYDETTPLGQTPQTEKILPKTSRETSQGTQLT